ncbi:hypothetical protein G6F65_015244 [Rhizopus arrhizus]|nr:hypothetical protein G6F65_015244 [Rhizopus arrhizus]
METENTMHRLLIVDDDNDIRTLLAEQLGRAGYQVSTAADGTAMRQLLDREHVDLIVLDLNLPREDGLTLRSTACWAWKWAPMITWPSRSSRARCWRASAP